jgi:hypothetical protein
VTDPLFVFVMALVMYAAGYATGWNLRRKASERP